jgi:hypothetical protein
LIFLTQNSIFFNGFPVSKKHDKIFFNGFLISSMAFHFLQRLSAFFNGLSNFPQRLSTLQDIWENLSLAASIQKIAIQASYFRQNQDIW